MPSFWSESTITWVSSLSRAPVSVLGPSASAATIKARFVRLFEPGDPDPSGRGGARPGREGDLGADSRASEGPEGGYQEVGRAMRNSSPARTASGSRSRTRNRLSRAVSPERSTRPDARQPRASARTPAIAALAFPFSGSDGHADPQRPGPLAQHTVLAGVRLGPDGQDRPPLVRGQLDHPRAPSNRAEPTRMKVAPSSIAAS